MNSDKLNKLLSGLSLKVQQINVNEAYVLGRNPPILHKEQEKKPDNRIPITLAKMTVDDMAGYAGKQGNIKVSYDLVTTEGLDEKDPFIEYMRAMDSYNESDIENSELYYEALEQGISYEIFWTSDAQELPNGLLTTEFKIVPGSEIVMVYSNDLKKVLLHAVHFNKDDDIETATVYYPLYKEEWARNNSGETWVLMSDENYPFTTVPVNEFRGNRRGLSIFDSEKHLIDTIDNIVAKSLNEIDRFSSSILLVGSEMTQKTVTDIKSNKATILDNLSADMDSTTFTPQYLEKNLSGVKDFTNELLKQVEQWYRDSTKTIDMSDEQFAGTQSGIAIKFKLIPMEFRASQIETYFNQGLKRRLGFYGDVYNASTANVNIDDYKTIIKSQRNIPVDDFAIVEMLQKLIGTLSDQTLLEALPQSIVPDPEKEIKRKEDQFSNQPDLFGEDIDGEATQAEGNLEALKLSGIQIKAANDIITLVGLPLDAGGITREAAIEQLTIFLGLSIDQAKRVLGNKQTGPKVSIKAVV